MKLIADRMLRGGGVIADVGESFTCSDKLGRALIAAGAAHPAPVEKAEPEPEPEPAPEIETAAEQPAEPVEKAVEPTAKPRRKARRQAAKKVSGKK